MFSTNFLYMYREYSFERPSLPRRSSEIRLLLTLSIRANSFTPSSLMLLCLRFRHLVHESDLKKEDNYVVALSLIWLCSRFTSQRPEFERSSAGVSPLILRKNTTSFLLLECSERIFPIMPPTSQRLFLDRSRVIKD